MQTVDISGNILAHFLKNEEKGMAIQISIITDAQKAKILSLEEGHFVDLKAIEIAPSKLTRHISAFANSDGGELYVGIGEIRNVPLRTLTWRGFRNVEAANGHLQAIEAIFPLDQDISFDFLQHQHSNGLVLKITVLKTRDVKKLADGKVYIRLGAQSQPIETPEGLRRLELNKGIHSFENETVNGDTSEISNSTVIIKFLLDVVPAAEPIVWLKKHRLILNELPTVAGILLFAEEPQTLMPTRCGIKIYRYKTRDAVGTRETLDFNPITISGYIYDQVFSAVNKTVEIVESIMLLGPQGFETIKYPIEALHEIITNAVLHRDYSIADDIHVRIFDNRIEVESPGRLPGHITVQNILTERFSRNVRIVWLINKFPEPPNKDVGEGLNTAFDAMRKLNLKEPIVEQRDNSVIVYLRHEALASPEEIVMNYLKVNPMINNSKGREVCHIGSENVMKRVFERLIESGMIERVPDLRGRAAAYRKKPSSE